MTLNSPWSLLFLLTVPAIIVLYILKQKNQEYSISSIRLWDEVLKDIEANSPWQKLRKNLLMILQIIAMILLVIALSGPFLDFGGSTENAIVVLETSLSMQSTDVSPSRLQYAKDKAVDFVRNLKPGTNVTLVSFSDKPQVEGSISSDRESTIKKIQAIKPTYRAFDDEGVSSLLNSLIKQKGASIAIFGDRKISLAGQDVRFIRVSGDGRNYAVLLLSHTVSKGVITVLGKIANYSPDTASLPVSLKVDGKVFDAKSLSIAPGETQNVYFDRIPQNAVRLELNIDVKDSLEADNTAYDSVNPVKTAKALLVSNKNVFLEKALSLKKNLELYKSAPGDVKGLHGYDLYVFDGFLPDTLPNDGNIIAINPPANKYFKTGVEVEPKTINKSSHPFFKYINDYSFGIGKTKALTLPAWADTVLDSDTGPLIFEGELQNTHMAVIGFDLHNSDIALKPVFPIFMTNMLETLVPQGVKNTESLIAGQSVEFSLSPKTEKAKIKMPSGYEETVAPPFPAGVFEDTDIPGQYVLEQTSKEGAVTHYFSVNVPSAKESNLNAVHDEAKSQDKNESKESRTGLDLKWFVVWAVLLLLIIEWWVYANGI